MLGTTSAYSRPTDKEKYELSTLVFTYASHTDDYGHLGAITGLRIGEMKSNSI